MPLIDELNRQLETASQLVQKTRAWLEACERESQAPLSQIEGHLLDLPGQKSNTSTTLQQLTDSARNSISQLTLLRDQLQQQADQLLSDGRQRVESLTNQSHQAQNRVNQLAQAVRSSTTTVEKRGDELAQQQRSLVNQCHKSGEEYLRLSTLNCQSLEASGKLPAETYNLELFSELLTQMSQLQTSLQGQSEEAVPSAAEAVRKSLVQTHLPQLRSCLEAWTTSLQQADQTYVRACQTLAQQHIEQMTAAVARSSQLVARQLPEEALTATKLSQESLQRAASEAADTDKGARDLADHLRQAQDPFLVAVLELHLALRRMVG